VALTDRLQPCRCTHPPAPSLHASDSPQASNGPPSLSPQGVVMGVTLPQFHHLLVLLAFEACDRGPRAQALRHQRQQQAGRAHRLTPADKVVELLGALGIPPAGAAAGQLPAAGLGDHQHEQPQGGQAVFWRTELAALPAVSSPSEQQAALAEHGGWESGSNEGWESDSSSGDADAPWPERAQADQGPGARVLALRSRRLLSRASLTSARQAKAAKPAHKRGQAQRRAGAGAHWRLLNYSEPSYIGGGEFEASDTVKAVYVAMRGHVAAVAGRARRAPLVW